MEKKELIKLGVIATSGVAVGFGAGFFVARYNFAKSVDALAKELEADYDKFAHEWRQKLSELGTTVVDLETPHNPADIYRQTVDQLGYAAEHAGETVKDLVSEHQNLDEPEEIVTEVEGDNTQPIEIGGVAEPTLEETDSIEIDDVEKPETISKNVFENTEELSEEELNRDPEVPYIIPIDKFMVDDEYDKISLTYFEGDESLLDDAEDLVREPEELVGPVALKFWIGLENKGDDVVYVRNEKLKADFEITRKEIAYGDYIIQQVAGLQEPKSNLGRRNDE